MSEATSNLRHEPITNLNQHYENANVLPKVDESPYLTTSVAVRPRNSNYANESEQAAAAGTTYVNETPQNLNLSSAYENNTNDLITQATNSVYEKI